MPRTQCRYCEAEEGLTVVSAITGPDLVCMKCKAAMKQKRKSRVGETGDNEPSQAMFDFMNPDKASA